ncbi:MAG: leader peptide processing enzyme [Spirochaetaceae bacterium]|nr:leader peptide processing enzyme [Spirochaetaceae bacterium]
MSKKTNTLLFILGATVLNVLIMVIGFVALLFLYGRLLAPRLPESVQVWGLPVIFLASMVLSFGLYRVILKQLLKRVSMEKYFAPLFSRKKRP